MHRMFEGIGSRLQVAAKNVRQNGREIIKGAALDTLNNRAVRLGLGAAGVGGLGGHAMAQTSTAPLDFTSTASTIAGYVPSAATAGLTIFAATFGVMVIKRVFMTVA